MRKRGGGAMRAAIHLLSIAACAPLHAALFPTAPSELTTADSVQLNWGVTPYIGQAYHARGVYFASHGLPFLTVDIRDRGNSEGEFHPFIQEAQDGYDVTEWLAQQALFDDDPAQTPDEPAAPAAAFGVPQQ